MHGVQQRNGSNILTNCTWLGIFRGSAFVCVFASFFLCADAQSQSTLIPSPRVESSRGPLTQQSIATEIPVTGTARKFLVWVSGHVGRASITLLNEGNREILYVFIRSESDHVGNLRYALPVRMADRNGTLCAMLGPKDEAAIEFPEGAEIKLTIQAKELGYQGVNVKELQSEIEIRHTLANGTRVTQKLKLVPNRLIEQNGQKYKDMSVEFQRTERTNTGREETRSVRFELRELRSEEFEGRSGGPPAFVVGSTSNHVETVQVHHLLPRRHEISHELPPSIRSGIHLGQGAKLGV